MYGNLVGVKPLKVASMSYITQSFYRYSFTSKCPPIFLHSCPALWPHSLRMWIPFQPTDSKRYMEITWPLMSFLDNKPPFAGSAL